MKHWRVRKGCNRAATFKEIVLGIPKSLCAMARVTGESLKNWGSGNRGGGDPLAPRRAVWGLQKIERKDPIICGPGEAGRVGKS